MPPRSVATIASDRVDRMASATASEMSTTVPADQIQCDRRRLSRRQQCDADEKTLKREDAVEKLTEMLKDLIARAGEEGLRLAPIGCPCIIEADGAIDRGAQNLPGNWESDSFNLPTRLCQPIAKIGPHKTMVLMHNDAVVQGLSKVPFMQDVRRRGFSPSGPAWVMRFTSHSERLSDQVA